MLNKTNKQPLNSDVGSSLVEWLLALRALPWLPLLAGLLALLADTRTGWGISPGSPTVFVGPSAHVAATVGAWFIPYPGCAAPAVVGQECLTVRLDDRDSVEDVHSAGDAFDHRPQLRKQCCGRLPIGSLDINMCVLYG